MSCDHVEFDSFPPLFLPTVLPSHHLAPIIPLHIRIHTQDVLALESHKIINVKLLEYREAVRACAMRPIFGFKDTSQAAARYAAHAIMGKHANITGLIELHQTPPLSKDDYPCSPMQEPPPHSRSSELLLHHRHPTALNSSQGEYWWPLLGSEDLIVDADSERPDMIVTSDGMGYEDVGHFDYQYNEQYGASLEPPNDGSELVTW
ncbi:hypothetical protein K443DRAFT_7515 [Laccaria amethystina LaAM-08-1]|uniref:Uncharacterized protein n=1 Tax=Laccaria amethystina LaAM-08-1 TaxID=1095629 RepID=A0A0C9XSD9_9AGAR|nr:hypothetical protein K443DRAFT_7515 [Laccaria amethystina LaAM-08-1]